MLRTLLNNLITWIKSFFIKEQWRLVDTLKASYRWTDMGGAEDKVYYYPYESNFGNRRCDVKATGYAKHFNRPREHSVYLESVYPWLQGKGTDIRNKNKKPNLKVVK